MKKILLLTFLICFILGIIAVIGFFAYIVVNAPEFNEELWEKAMNKEVKQEVQEQPKKDDRMKGGSGAKLPF